MVVFVAGGGEDGAQLITPLKHPLTHKNKKKQKTSPKNKGGAVLVAEMLLDEGGAGPADAALQSLNMLAQTHGRERRLSEYAALLEGVGFSRVEGRRTGAYLDAVLAHKK